MTNLQSHPVADLFPMLPDDELAELAADIKERGQLQPIVLDAEGRILDGRNRYAACQITGVEPRFETYEGDDPAGYALAVNIARRHLTTGARAIIVAKAATTMGYGAQQKVASFANLQNSQVSRAKVVLEWAPHIVDAVIAGAKPLSVAHEEAQQRKREAAELKAKISRLRQNAADLLALVNEERMDVDDAIAALNAREEKARQEAEQREREEKARLAEEERQEAERAAAEQRERRTATLLLCKLIPALAEIDGEKLAALYDPDEEPDDYQVTSEMLIKASEVLENMTAAWQERELP